MVGGLEGGASLGLFLQNVVERRDRSAGLLGTLPIGFLFLQYRTGNVFAFPYHFLNNISFLWLLYCKKTVLVPMTYKICVNSLFVLSVRLWGKQ